MECEAECGGHIGARFDFARWRALHRWLVSRQKSPFRHGSAFVLQLL